MTESKRNDTEERMSAKVGDETVLSGTSAGVEESPLMEEGECGDDSDDGYKSLSILEKTRVDVLKNYIRKELQAEQKMMASKKRRVSVNVEKPVFEEDGLEYKPERGVVDAGGFESGGEVMEEGEDECEGEEGEEGEGVFLEVEVEEETEDEDEDEDDGRVTPPPLPPTLKRAVKSTVSSSRMPKNYQGGKVTYIKRSPPLQPKKRALEERKKRGKNVREEIAPKKLYFV